MVATPIWFGPTARPLAGWLHRSTNSDVARACIVFCPTLGLEAAYTYFALRQLAEDLAGLGFLVLRFDYDGTGDSDGASDDMARVQAWCASIEAALDLVSGLSSAPTVLLGSRAGGLLATEVARQRAGIDGLILWDAPRSGRSYLREQRIRYSTSYGDDTQSPGALGIALAPETMKDLALIDLTKLDRLPARLSLVLQRSGPDLFPPAVPPISTSQVIVVEAHDQDELLLLQRTPVDTMRRIVEWVAETFNTGHPIARDLHAVENADSSIDIARRRGSLSERFVMLGPHRMFGVTSEPKTHSLTSTILCLPDHFTPHVGLSRMWVELARAWASAGLRTIRFDLSGNGDSPARPGKNPHQYYPLAHVDDVDDVVAAASPDRPSNVVLVGVCSGAYQCLEAALVHSPRAICLVNPAFSFVTSERPADRRRQARQATRQIFTRPLGRPLGSLARRFSSLRKLDESFDWSRWLEACYWQGPLIRAWPGMPESIRWLLMKLLLNQRPVDILGRIVALGTDVLLIVGDQDLEVVSLGAKRDLKRLDDAPNFRLAHLVGLDHSLLKAGQCERVIEELTTHVLTKFGSPSVDLTGAEVADSGRPPQVDGRDH